jgi:hypothetical protein
MGYLFQEEYAFWDYKHRGHFPERNGHCFSWLINHSVVVYLDDVTIFSKNKKDHLSHLRAILERCWKYTISLNPKKLVFAVEKGKLRRFIVSNDDIIIDPERTQGIAKLPPPSSKKSM